MGIRVNTESKVFSEEAFKDVKSDHEDDINKSSAVNQDIIKQKPFAEKTEKEAVTDAIESKKALPEKERTPSIVDAISGMMGVAVGVIRRSSTETSAMENISNKDSIESMEVETNIAEKVEAKSKV